MKDQPQQAQITDSSEGGPAVATVTRPAEKTAPPRVDRLPPWRVLLHNDDHNDMADVVLAIRMLVRLPASQAFACMLEAHRRGVALLTETHREHAELLVEQFATFNLKVTAEAAT